MDLYGNDTRCQDYTPTFSGGVSEILIRECFQCHTNKLQLGQVTLEGYENVMPYANNGSLVGSIEHASGFSPMPKDRSKLSFCEIEIVKEWIAAGALDN